MLPMGPVPLFPLRHIESKRVHGLERVMEWMRDGVHE